METGTFAGSARNFTKSPLGIIALFIVLVYGFASLVVGRESNLAKDVVPLIYFMVFFPALVFLGFLWLVAKHHNKLYGPSDFKDEENYIRAQMATAALLGAAAAKQSGDGVKATDVPLGDIVNVAVNVPRHPAPGKSNRRLLWVDDRPQNNVYERKAFEAQGIDVALALSTNEALELLQANKYAAIISDMGRKEGRQEGYVLLEKLREMGDKTPFVIYAASNQPEHKKMAREKGAIGLTNRADELFQMVMDVVAKEK